MPATFAHPVFAIPFARLGLPLSALVIGAMAPDLAYVLPWPIPRVFRHNLAGIFVFALPVGLAVLWIYHRVIKLPASRLLTQRLRAQLGRKLAPFAFGPWPRFLRIALAVLIGAGTHVGVDEFTHVYGWPVEHFAILRTVVIHTRFEPVQLYKVLQYGLSVIGTAIIAWWMRDHLRALIPTRADPGRLPRIFAMIGASLLSALVYATLEGGGDFSDRAIKTFVVRFIAASLVAAALIILGYSAAWHWAQIGEATHRPPTQ